MNYPELERAISVIKKLRDPDGGCPWDLEQTHESLLPFLLEETYEYLHAVETDNKEEMKDELGDILLQVILHSTIADQENNFSIEDVAKNLADKLIRRHPHVFDEKVGKLSQEQIKENWQKIKKEEKTEKKQKYQYELPMKELAFPALTSAERIGKITRRLNFDWDNAPQVAYKVEEEWQELKEEISGPEYNMERVEEEMGDFLFSIAQLARHLKLDPEMTLRHANKKFISRFQKVEELITQDGKKFEEMNQMELDEYWNQVKNIER
jgi:MazG family protein